MIRKSDWLLLPGEPSPMPFGIWKRPSGWHLHRSVVPVATADLQPGKPMWQEEWPPVDPAMPLRGYQREGAEFARERDGSILAFEMGTGKTRTALAAIRHPARGQRILVVSPKVAFDVWRKEVALIYGPDYPVIHVRGRRLNDDMNEFAKPGVYLLNPEILSARWSEWLWLKLDALIFDEAHLFTRGRAGRTRAAAAVANLAKQRIALTGTPILRHTMDLHGILQAVVPGAYGSWVTLAKMLGQARGKYGWELGDVPPEQRAWLEARLADTMVVRKWADVADDVPPIQRDVIRVDLTPAEREEYVRLSTDVRAALGDEVSVADLMRAATQLTQMGALRLWIAKAKIDSVVELVQTSGEPCVIWTWHREIARAISTRLHGRGRKPVVVTGAERERKRRERIEMFQSGEVDTFVATMAVAGVGIDLTRARLTVNAEMSYTPADHAQSEARVFRSGQKLPCMTYWLVVRGTVEDRVVEILMQKAVHARSEIFPDGIAVEDAYDAERTMVSLLDHAMEEL